MDSFIKDDMLFVPYMDDGFQCKMKVNNGVISVRFGGSNLITDNEHPYEVFYPDKDAPYGYQTAADVWGYILKHIPIIK